MDRGTWWGTVHRVARVGHGLATKQQQLQQRIENLRNRGGEDLKTKKSDILDVT